jgi:ATP-dependent Clp protease ATP-binding subunit ClpA
MGSANFRKLTSPFGFLAKPVAIDQVRGDIMREVESRLSPELRNRIDQIVLFAPLSAADVRQIAADYLWELEATLAKAGKTLEIDDDALDMIAADGYSVAFGARFLKRVIDERVKLPMTMRWNDGSHFRVRVEGQAIVVQAVSARLAAA